MSPFTLSPTSAPSTAADVSATGAPLGLVQPAAPGISFAETMEQTLVGASAAEFLAERTGSNRDAMGNAAGAASAIPVATAAENEISFVSPERPDASAHDTDEPQVGFDQPRHRPVERRAAAPPALRMTGIRAETEFTESRPEEVVLESLMVATANAAPEAKDSMESSGTSLLPGGPSDQDAIRSLAEPRFAVPSTIVTPPIADARRVVNDRGESAGTTPASLEGNREVTRGGKSDSPAPSLDPRTHQVHQAPRGLRLESHARVPLASPARTTAANSATSDVAEGQPLISPTGRQDSVIVPRMVQRDARNLPVPPAAGTAHRAAESALITIAPPSTRSALEAETPKEAPGVSISFARATDEKAPSANSAKLVLPGDPTSDRAVEHQGTAGSSARGASVASAWDESKSQFKFAAAVPPEEPAQTLAANSFTGSENSSLEVQTSGQVRLRSSTQAPIPADAPRNNRYEDRGVANPRLHGNESAWKVRDTLSAERGETGRPTNAAAASPTVPNPIQRTIFSATEAAAPMLANEGTARLTVSRPAAPSGHSAAASTEFSPISERSDSQLGRVAPPLAQTESLRATFDNFHGASRAFRDAANDGQGRIQSSSALPTQLETAALPPPPRPPTTASAVAIADGFDARTIPPQDSRGGSEAQANPVSNAQWTSLKPSLPSASNPRLASEPRDPWTTESNERAPTQLRIPPAAPPSAIATVSAAVKLADADSASREITSEWRGRVQPHARTDREAVLSGVLPQSQSTASPAVTPTVGRTSSVGTPTRDDASASSASSQFPAPLQAQTRPPVSSDRLQPSPALTLDQGNAAVTPPSNSNSVTLPLGAQPPKAATTDADAGTTGPPTPMPLREEAAARQIRRGISAAKVDSTMDHRESHNQIAAPESAAENFLRASAASPRREFPGAHLDLPPLPSSDSAAVTGAPRPDSAVSHGPLAAAFGSAERYREMISEIGRHVVEFKRLDLDSMNVLVRADSNTELSLKLTQRDGVVQITAQCERGDFQKLNAHWDDLQQRLATRGIRLGELESVPANSLDAFHGSPGRSSDQPAEEREPRWQRTPIETLVEPHSPRPVRTAAKSPSTPPGTRVWEAWA